jgi:hypothetical protein
MQPSGQHLSRLKGKHGHSANLAFDSNVRVTTLYRVLKLISFITTWVCYSIYASLHVLPRSIPSGRSMSASSDLMMSMPQLDTQALHYVYQQSRTKLSSAAFWKMSGMAAILLLSMNLLPQHFWKRRRAEYVLRSTFYVTLR